MRTRPGRRPSGSSAAGVVGSCSQLSFSPHTSEIKSGMLATTCKSYVAVLRPSVEAAGGTTVRAGCKTRDGEKYSREKEILLDRNRIGGLALLMLAAACVGAQLCEAAPAAAAHSL